MCMKLLWLRMRTPTTGAKALRRSQFVKVQILAFALRASRFPAPRMNVVQPDGNSLRDGSRGKELPWGSCELCMCPMVTPGRGSLEANNANGANSHHVT